MQALGSSTDSYYGSTDSTEVLENTYGSPDFEHLRDPAQTIVQSPLSRLHEITLAQEDVSQARKDLLVERSKTKSAGEAVRLQRIVTGNIEGQLLSALRESCNANAEALPASIANAYERVIQERDRLGSIEDSYIEAERALGGSEWMFMQKEDMLYQYHFPDLRAHMESTLPKHDARTDSRPPPPPPDPVLLGEQTILVHNAPPPPPLPPPPPEIRSLNSREPEDVTEPPSTTQIQQNSKLPLENQYKAAVTELDNLRKEFDSLRSQQSEVLDLELGNRISHAKLSEHRVDSQKFFNYYTNLLEKLAEKEVQVQQLRVKKWGPPDLDADLSRRTPDEWMLDFVKTNSMERKMYMNALEDTGISISHGDPLDEWSDRYWFSCTTDCSSYDGQHSTQVLGNQHNSTSSTGNDMDGSAQRSATPEGYPATQQSQRSVPSLTSEEGLSQFKGHEVHTGRLAHFATKSDSAAHCPVSAKPSTQSTDLRILNRPPESLYHRRRKSTSAIFEQRDATESGENFVNMPHLIQGQLCVN
ncbi:hypothetical protein PMIN04_011443 [Paraphaeosphaeria minitans]